MRRYVFTLSLLAIFAFLTGCEQSSPEPGPVPRYQIVSVAGEFAHAVIVRLDTITGELRVYTYVPERGVLRENLDKMFETTRKLANTYRIIELTRSAQRVGD